MPVYSGLFILLVQLAAAVPTPAAWAVLTAAPLASARSPAARSTRSPAPSSRASTAARPSSTGCGPTPPSRPATRAAWPIGCGVGLALVVELPLRDPLLRFLFGGAVGALAYAGVDLLRDGWAIRGGPRQLLQAWRLYALGAALGGSRRRAPSPGTSTRPSSP